MPGRASPRQPRPVPGRPAAANPGSEPFPARLVSHRPSCSRWQCPTPLAPRPGTARTASAVEKLSRAGGGRTGGFPNLWGPPPPTAAAATSLATILAALETGVGPKQTAGILLPKQLALTLPKPAGSAAANLPCSATAAVPQPPLLPSPTGPNPPQSQTRHGPRSLLHPSPPGSAAPRCAALGGSALTWGWAWGSPHAAPPRAWGAGGTEPAAAPQALPEHPLSPLVSPQSGSGCRIGPPLAASRHRDGETGHAHQLDCGAQGKHLPRHQAETATESGRAAPHGHRGSPPPPPPIPGTILKNKPLSLRRVPAHHTAMARHGTGTAG